MANNRPERYTNLIHARVPQDGSRTVTDYRFSYDDPRRYGLTQDPSGIGVPTPAEVTAGVTPANYAYPPGNVKRYGAVGDGSHDDTSAIQAAIAVAESQWTGLAPPYVWPSIQVELPAEGDNVVYKISDTLTVTKPITIFGPGAETAVIFQTASVPAFVITLDTAMTYNKPTLRGFTICGNGSGNWAAAWTSLPQHGIKLNANTSAVHDARVSVHNVDIYGMNGHGIWLHDKTNSCEIVGCRIQSNYAAGIYMDGTFSTNYKIKDNVIRDNRVGIYINPTSAIFATGNITENLLESNVQGSGAVGSSLRPCIALWMKSCQCVNVTNNYFENHLNDVFFEDSCSFNRFNGNVWLAGNSFPLVTQYGGPPNRQFGIYITAGTYNLFEGNHFFSRPEKPSGTTDADWGTAGFGTKYEHVQDLTGTNAYLYNRCNYVDGANIINGGLLVTNPFSRHDIRNYETDTSDASGRGFDSLYAFKQRQQFGGHKIERGVSQTISETTALLNPTAEIFNFTSSGSASYHERGSNVDAALERVNPFGYVWLSWWNLGTGTSRWSYASAAPTTGFHNDGEIIWNSAPTASGNIGWVCVSAGTPGTWKTFGAISA